MLLSLIVSVMTSSCCTECGCFYSSVRCEGRSQEGGVKTGHTYPRTVSCYCNTVTINLVLNLCSGGSSRVVRRYSLAEMYSDLVHFAARYLVRGGRLVYWVPGVRAE